MIGPRLRPLEQLSTSRLLGERMRPEHADWLAEFHRDEQVMATLGGVRSETESAAWLKANLDHWDDWGFGQWMLRMRDTGELVGRGGLRWMDPFADERIVEIGYAFCTSVWGNGLASEAAAAFVRVAHNHYGFTELGAVALETNVGSLRVLAGCGFVDERSVDHPTGCHRFLRNHLDGAESDVMELERRLLMPTIRADRAAVDELLHPDFREIGASGRTWTRAETLDELADESGLPAAMIRDLRAERIDRTTILVTYETDRGSRVARRSSLWVVHDGRWRVRFHQGTPDPGASRSINTSS